MKFFDVGQEAHGVIAIGQVATGVFAFGQMATGVVAVGQLARGVFVVGQLAVGFFCIGQLAIGVLGAVGMIGVAGRWAKGLVFPILPPAKKDGATPLPPLTPLERIVAGASGWIRARLEPRGEAVAVLHDGTPVTVEMEGTVLASARAAAQSGWPHVLLMLRSATRMAETSDVGYRDRAPTERVLVADGIEPLPRPPWSEPRFWLITGLRLLGVAILSTVWLYVVGADLLAALG